jgi:hypothetical protein
VWHDTRGMSAKVAGEIKKKQARGGAGESRECACEVGGRLAVLSGAMSLGSLGSS